MKNYLLSFFICSVLVACSAPNLQEQEKIDEQLSLKNSVELYAYVKQLREICIDGLYDYMMLTGDIGSSLKLARTDSDMLKVKRRALLSLSELNGKYKELSKKPLPPRLKSLSDKVNSVVIHAENLVSLCPSNLIEITNATAISIDSGRPNPSTFTVFPQLIEALLSTYAIEITQNPSSLYYPNNFSIFMFQAHKASLLLFNIMNAELSGSENVGDIRLKMKSHIDVMHSSVSSLDNDVLMIYGHTFIHERLKNDPDFIFKNSRNEIKKNIDNAGKNFEKNTLMLFEKIIDSDKLSEGDIRNIILDFYNRIYYEKNKSQNIYIDFFDYLSIDNK